MRAIFAGMILVALAAGFAAAPAAGQGNVMTVETTQETYGKGEVIIVTGTVSAIIDNNPVLLQIFDMDGGIVEIAQIQLAQDGSYSNIVIPEGERWDRSGMYVVRASHGIGNTVETTFEFVVYSEIVVNNIFEVDAGSSGTFDVGYTIRGGTIRDMVIVPNMLTLEVTMDATGDGMITLDLPREYVDARENGCEGGDEVFITLIDGKETPYKIVSVMSDSRTIEIKFAEGDETLEIVATCMIPEFGTIAVVVLAAATALGVTLTGRRITHDGSAV